MVSKGKKTTEEYNEYMRVYMIQRYHRIRNEMVLALGSKCVRCGSVDGLQIDHIDRTKKMMNVERMTFVKAERRQKELENCQLLCQDCHTIKTVTEDLGRKFAEHGDQTMYRHYKCRCDKCKEGQRIRNKKYRSKSRVRNSMAE